MEVIFYTTHCPKCSILAKKLNMGNIEYTECTDIDLMQNLGFTEMPMLKVDNKIMNFKEACNWINSMQGDLK